MDINVHPTKQEIKFEDEKIVYAFVQAAVKHALAQFSITPTLDFDLDPGIQQLDAVSKPLTDETRDAISSSSLFQSFTQKNRAHFIDAGISNELKHWKQDVSQADTGNEKTIYPETNSQSPVFTMPSRLSPLTVDEQASLSQLLNTYIVAPTNRGFVLIHQQSAHERILYENYAAAAQGKPIAAQRSLFPITFELSAQDAVMLRELLEDLLQLGYLVEPFGRDSFVIQGIPADLPAGNEKSSIENLLEQFKHFSSDIKFSKREKLMRSLAVQRAIKPGNSMAQAEMRSLVNDLFACAQPNITPGGNPVFIEFKNDYLEKLFLK